MHIIPTIIEGAFILEPRVWGDERGYFFESFGTKYLEPLGTKYNFVQDNEAMSKYGVIRGLHYQLPPFAQTNLRLYLLINAMIIITQNMRVV